MVFVHGRELPAEWVRFVTDNLNRLLAYLQIIQLDCSAVALGKRAIGMALLWQLPRIQLSYGVVLRNKYILPVHPTQ